MLNEQLVTKLQLQGWNGTIDEMASQLDKEVAKLLSTEWKVGFSDQGLGRGGYGIIVRDELFSLVLCQLSDKKILEYICRLHNENLKSL